MLADSTIARLVTYALPHLSEVVVVHETDGIYRVMTSSIRKLTGWRPSELIGRHPCLWTHPEDIPIQRKYHDALLHGVAVHGRLRFRHREGHYLWIDFTGVPLFEDPSNPRAVSAIITCNRDATLLVEAEQAVHKRNSHLTLMHDLAGLAWFTCNLRTGQFKHNEAFVELTGQAASSFDSRRAWQPFVHPSDRAALRRAMFSLWRLPSGDTRTVEMRLSVTPQYVRWVRMSLVMVDHVCEDSPPMRVLHGVLLDIDELVRSREQTQRWILQRERMGQRERQDVAHELHDEVGQILTGLRWQIEAFQRHAAVDPKSVRVTEVCPFASWMDSLEQAHTTLRQIAHRLRPPLAALGLRAALLKLTEEFSHLWLGKTKLDLYVDDGLPNCDEWRVNLVLGILRESLNNVSRHAHASLVKVRATLPFQGLLRILVQDNGVGMDLHTAQAGETLGLTSLRERARLLDARFTIDSAPGAGTRIVLELRMNGPVHAEPRKTFPHDQ